MAMFFKVLPLLTPMFSHTSWERISYGFIPFESYFNDISKTAPRVVVVFFNDLDSSNFKSHLGNNFCKLKSVDGLYLLRVKLSPSKVEHRVKGKRRTKATLSSCKQSN